MKIGVMKLFLLICLLSLCSCNEGSIGIQVPSPAVPELPSQQLAEGSSFVRPSFPEPERPVPTEEEMITVFEDNFEIFEEVALFIDGYGFRAEYVKDGPMRFEHESRLEMTDEIEEKIKYILNDLNIKTITSGGPVVGFDYDHPGFYQGYGYISDESLEKHYKNRDMEEGKLRDNWWYSFDESLMVTESDPIVK